MTQISTLPIPGIGGNYRLTTDNSASRYGIPVVERIDTGAAVDPTEIVHDNGFEQFSVAHMVLEAIAYCTDPADVHCREYPVWTEAEVEFATRYLNDVTAALGLPVSMI